ncbi:hypothetical protein INT47_004957, partial [Mucor saturninus]
NVEDQEVHLLDIDNNNNFPENKNLIDFDLYSTDSTFYPTLTPTKYNNNTTNVDPTNTPPHVVIETLPIIYPKSFIDDLQHLSDLNAMATTLPLYPVMYNGQVLQVLIDSGASENCVSPHVIQSLDNHHLIPVTDCHVETAGGMVSQIKHKVEIILNLNGVQDKITAFVFTTKFDLILGRSWLKQTRPLPDWNTDTWYLNNGRVKLTPSTNIKRYSPTSLPNLNYLITHKQADRIIKKGGESFLFVIKSVNPDTAYSLDKTTYWNDLVKEFTDVFKDTLPGLPPDRGIHHLIDTGDAQPVSRPPYKMSPLELEELQKQLTELLKLGLIKPSSSPWGAGVLFVRKKPDPGSNKPGSLRMCADYRSVNKYTVRNSSSLPRIEECLDKLSGARYFTSLDLRSGYHQIRIAPEDVPKTAFNTRYGQFSWLVLPFGLCNAPPVFQTLMNRILGEYIDKTTIVYLDDILIYSKTLDEHKIHVRQILDVLRKEKLIANLKKCEFCRKELNFVGFRITETGISPSPEKVQVVQQWSRMKNVQEVRQFIGFAKFYKRFIKNFASIAAPLTDLTRGTGIKTRPIVWNNDCQVSFDRLKKLLSSSLVLQVVRMDKPFRIEVDASDRGCGATLLQPDDDPNMPWHPLCFESKKFADSESKLPAQEKELLGILHALRTWRCYVEGCPKGYTVYSDHLPLQYFCSKENPPNRLVRWINELELYSPEILYKPGKENTVPDILSRMNFESNNQSTTDVKPMESDYLYVTWTQLPAKLRSDWPMLLLPETRKKLKLAEVKAVLDKEEKYFHVAANQVYRKISVDAKTGIKLVPFLPFAERADTVARYHDSFGHAGYKTLLKMLIPRFWWPSMRLDNQQWISVCPSCQVNSRKGLAHHDEMHPLKVPTAFDRWHLDFLDLPTTLKGNRWLLVGVDYATNWCGARAVPVASKEVVVDFIYEEIVMNFGVMSEICTDRGANFTSGLVQEYIKRIGLKFKLTSAYHPRTNAKAERFNGVIKQMLRKYTNGALHRWDDFVHAALWACRIRLHTTTGFSPFYLTYGREPRLPGDVLHPYIDNSTFKDPRTVADITSRELADLGQHRVAAEFRLKAMAEKDKIRWDAAIKKVTFEPGDMVMLTHEGRYGLEPKFKGPFIVVEVFPDFGTYKLQTLAGEPLKSLVHVDRLRIARGDRPEEPWYDPTSARREHNTIMKDLDKTTEPLKGDHIDPLQPDFVQNFAYDSTVPPVSNSVPPVLTSIPPVPDSVPLVSNSVIPTSSTDIANEDTLMLPDSRKLAIAVVPKVPNLPPSPIISNAVSSTSASVQSRTQGLKGGNVKPMIVDEPDVSESHVTVRTNLTEPINDMDMDMPLEVELRLKKSKAQKRRFVPNINQANRKRPKK